MTVTMTAPRTRVDPEAMPSPPDPEVPEGQAAAPSTSSRSCVRPTPTEPGQIGALLRRERLYSSHLVDWRRQREAERSRPWRASAAPACRPNPGRGRAAAAGKRAPRQAAGAGGEDHRDQEKSRAAGDPARPGQRRRAERELVTAVDAVAPDLGAAQACGRWGSPGDAVPAPAAAVSTRELSRAPRRGHCQTLNARGAGGVAL